MVAPHVIVFYTSTWKYVVKRDRPSENDIHDFIKALPTLSSYLSCAVCRKLLKGDPLFSVELCDHYVCKDCKGLAREANQICGNCRDWEDFSEDETLVALLAGHSRYCRIFLRSSDCTSFLEKQEASLPSLSNSLIVDTFRILDILQEGASIGGSKRSIIKEPRVNARIHPIDDIIQSKSSSDKQDSILKIGQIPNNVASCNSSLVNNSASSSSKFIHKPITVREEKLVQVILKDVDHNDDSIDIKIEPVYQRRGDDEDDEDNDMESDSENSKDANCLDQISAENEIGEGNDDDEEMPAEMETDGAGAAPDAEESIRTTTTTPLTPQTLSIPSTSIAFSIPSSTGGAPQVIYARTTASFPHTVQKLSSSSTPLSLSATQPPPVMQFSPRLHSFVLTRPVATISTNPAAAGTTATTPQRTLSSGEVRLHSGQTIRLARLALADGRPVTMVRQLQGPGGSSGIRHITLPINTSDLMKKKIIVRPAGGLTAGPSTSATTSQLQRWPDANAVLQYASGSGTVISQSQGLHTVTISQSQPITRPPSSAVDTTTTLSSSSSSSNIAFTTTNTQTKPNTKIYTGGAVTTNHLYNNASTSSSSSSSPSPTTTATFTDASGNIIGTTISLPEALRKTVNIRIPNKNKTSTKVRSGCRCGNAASQPSKLTCCGQRCICYVDGKSCDLKCRCKGCNNPYIPGGKKLMQGLNAVIDTKTNHSVPIMSAGGSSSMASSSIGHGGNISSMNFVAAASSNSNTIVTTAMSSPSTMNLVPMMAHGSTTTSMAPHIFTRIHHPGTSPQPTTTTFSQIIPVANFTGQFGQFIPLPISLISPAHAGHTIQSHSDTIHLQNIQLNPNLNLQNQ